MSGKAISDSEIEKLIKNGGEEIENNFNCVFASNKRNKFINVYQYILSTIV